METRELVRLKNKAKRLISRGAEPGATPDRGDQNSTLSEGVSELDICEKALQLQQLELAEERQKSNALERENATLFNQSPVGLMITNQSGFIERINPHAEAILQCKRGPLVGETFSRFAADVSIDTFHSHVKNVLRHNLPQVDVITLSVRHTTKTVRLTSKPYQLHHTEKSQILSILEDITAQRETSNELALATAVFSHTSEGILVCDHSDIIVRVNKALEVVTGYKSDEIKGVSCRTFLRDFINVAGIDDSVSANWRALIDGSDVKATDKSGQGICLHVQCAPKNKRDEGLYNVILLSGHALAAKKFAG